MSLQKGKKVGPEVHELADQFLRVESGRAKLTVGGRVMLLGAGHAAVVPAGVRHTIENPFPAPVKLYAIYSVPVH